MKLPNISYEIFHIICEIACEENEMSNSSDSILFESNKNVYDLSHLTDSKKETPPFGEVLPERFNICQD